MAKKFTVDARLILQLGRDSIKSHTTALVELIKNSYDADATKVEVEIFSNRGQNNLIRVADNGFGMTEKDIDNHWLRIGYSEKTLSKMSKKGRRKAGEKGIGRIAADRLGSILKLTTKSDEDDIQGIQVNWDDFDVQDQIVENISIKEIQSPTIKIPQKENEKSETGTELIITSLRQPWSKENIQNFYTELSLFSPLIGSEIEIDFKNDIDPTFSRKIQTALYSAAEIDITVHYDGKTQLIYEFKNKIAPVKNKTEIFELSQFLSRQNFSNKELKFLRCGPLDIKLHFFVRKSSLLEGTKFSLKDLKQFLSENAGVRIYRDKIVVKPYGFPHSDFGRDWLGLDLRKSKDPAGIGRSSYKINANQLVGSVSISRDKNNDLKDSAAREGLVENEAFEDLRDLILASINLLESYRIDITKENSENKNSVQKGPSAYRQLNAIKSKLTEVVKDLNDIKENRKDAKGASIAYNVNQLNQVIEETEKTVEELLEEKRVLSALATLGISSAVFAHETETAINTFRDAASNAKGFLTKRNPDISIAIEELDEAVRQAKLIAGWGVFALSRVENDKRKKQTRSITEIIKKTITQLKPAFDSLEIKIEKKLDNVIAKTYAMDIESIIVNLLTNSFNAVPNSNNPRKIRVELFHENKTESKGFKIIVADSGPGIANEYLDKIWIPLWTTKVGKKGREGTGLGLTIVKSIVDEFEGEIRVEKDNELKGAKFIIWLPR
jgi:signal transduction histidine kinase